MKARITIDGVDSLLKNSKGLALDNARVAFLAIAKTANPLAKTAVNGAKFFADAVAVADGLMEMGKPDSVVCFYEIPEGKTVEKKSAEYTLANFAARVKLSASADLYTGTIFADEKAEKSDDGKPEQARGL
jgi:hypothetical protein